MPRTISTRSIKANRTYDTIELSKALGIHATTVRTWVAQGLPILKGRRPYLFLGLDVRLFLEGRKAKLRYKLCPGELFCLTCHQPRQPLAMMVDLVRNGKRTPRIMGLCEVCERPMHKMVSEAAIPALTKIFAFGPNADSTA